MEETQKYIILNTTIGEGRDLLTGRRTTGTVRGGDILELSHGLEQPEDPGKIALRYEWATFIVELPKQQVSQLTNSEYDLLYAVLPCEERLRVYLDKARLMEAQSLDVGSKVFVKVTKQNEDRELPGVIRWKGKLLLHRFLLSLYGTCFGVELLGKESEGFGDNDGMHGSGILRKRYFTCPANQGVFVAVDKLRLQQDQDQELVAQLLASLDEERKTREEVARRLHELESSLAGESNAHRETQRRLRSKEQRLNEVEASLAAKREEHQEVERRLHSSEHRTHELDLILTRERQEHQQRLIEVEASLAAKREEHQEVERRLHSSEHRTHELELILARERQEHQQRLNELEASLAEQRRAHEETEATLATVRQAYEDYRGTVESTRDWVISQDDVTLSDRVIGSGAWGEVKEGTFRECKVAVKTIHELILSDHNRRLFEREMNMASRCRHPCLLQFIGATNADDQSPLFVTELMDTSLRAVLRERSLEPVEIKTIALDVAKGLNYLHLNHPVPIIHRDISNANVLLWKHDSAWRAKVSDYGTANFLQHSMTACPGAVAYSAPEAQTSRQSPKLDVYSFGVLLCEMNVREMPDPDHRNEQVAMVTNNLFRNLIRRCVQQNPEDRPSMAEIIQILERTPQ